MIGAIVDAVPDLEPISLEDMNGAAALTERRDRKYVVGEPTLALVAAEAGPPLRVLEIDGIRRFDYQSVYFDTPDLDTYLAAARSRPERFKVRTRSHVSTGDCALEVKWRNRCGVTVKHRLSYAMESSMQLTDDGVAFLGEFLASDVIAVLRPSLTVTYQRTTLFDPVSRSRITIDTGLQGRAPGGSEAAPLAGTAILETKSVGHSIGFDRLLWAHHARPLSFSKYGTLLASIDPSLPANKWNRVLRRRFDWEPAHS